MIALGCLVAAGCGSIEPADSGVDGGNDVADGGLEAAPDNWTACGVLPDAAHEYWDCCDGSLCRGDVTPESWPTDYVSAYGGTYGEEEQVFGS